MRARVRVRVRLYQSERRDGVEDAERGAATQQEDGGGSDGWQLEHEEHLAVGAADDAEHRPLERREVVPRDQRHGERRGEEDPAPQSHERPERDCAARVEGEEDEVGERLAHRLADGVARRAELLVPLREHREREAVHRNVLRRREEDKAAEEEREGAYVGGRATREALGEPGVDVAAGVEEQHADR